MVDAIINDILAAAIGEGINDNADEVVGMAKSAMIDLMESVSMDDTTTDDKSPDIVEIREADVVEVIIEEDHEIVNIADKDESEVVAIVTVEKSSSMGGAIVKKPEATCNPADVEVVSLEGRQLVKLVTYVPMDVDPAEFDLSTVNELLKLTPEEEDAEKVARLEKNVEKIVKKDEDEKREKRRHKLIRKRQRQKEKRKRQQSGDGIIDNVEDEIRKRFKGEMMIKKRDVLETPLEQQSDGQKQTKTAPLKWLTFKEFITSFCKQTGSLRPPKELSPRDRQLWAIDRHVEKTVEDMARRDEWTEEDYKMMRDKFDQEWVHLANGCNKGKLSSIIPRQLRAGLYAQRLGNKKVGLTERTAYVSQIDFERMKIVDFSCLLRNMGYTTGEARDIQSSVDSHPTFRAKAMKVSVVETMNLDI